jgi:hypothetical protein
MAISYLDFTWDRSGHCAQVYVFNSSYFAAK